MCKLTLAEKEYKEALNRRKYYLRSRIYAVCRLYGFQGQNAEDDFS